MRRLFNSIPFPLVTTLLAFVLSTFAPLGPLASAQSWEVTWKNYVELNLDGRNAEELSGVSYLGSSGGVDEFVAIQDDDGKLVFLDTVVHDSGFLVSALRDSREDLIDDSFDFEGIAAHPTQPGRVFASYERDKDVGAVIPGVREYDIETGGLIRAAPLPSVWTTNGNTISNRGFESLARTPDGTSLWTANEEALTIDGNRATGVSGTTVRLQRIAVSPVSLVAGEQYAYQVDPVHGANPERSGLVELVALPDGGLLSLERSAAGSAPIFESRIYHLDFTDATDVSAPVFNNGLIGRSYTPVTKTLLWSGQVDGGLGANMEGLSVGRQLPDGSWSMIGVVDNSGGDMGNLIVAFTLSPPASVLDGDFDGDGGLDCADIDSLVATIVQGSHDAVFDLTGDGLINGADQVAWLAAAGPANGFAGPFRTADANLDGSVDVSDLNLWNSNKFTAGPGWCAGDWNHDGLVDVSDLNLWNANKFTSSDAAVAVPEPASWLMLGLGLAWFLQLKNSLRNHVRWSAGQYSLN